MKYANIVFDRHERLTVGDDIQIIAVENLYRHMGIDYSDVVRIPFHELAEYDGEYVVLPVSFPLYGYHADIKITQFSPRIIPVFLALSLLESEYSREEIDYLKRFEPVGCRDEYTMRNLRKHNISAYVNGCMTAAFAKRGPDEGGTEIYCIDIQEELKDFMPARIKEEAVFRSHTFYPDELPDGPEAKARELLEEYRKNAGLVITSRLHAAVPCSAMGIPVIWAKDKLSYRFLGMNRLIHVYTKEEYGNIDWDPQPAEYEELKKKMLRTAADRIQSTVRKYEGILQLSSFYEHKKPENYYIEFYSNTVEYIKNNFEEKQAFAYVLWGVTQTASLIFEYISANYPNARLAGVIDKNKDVVFAGMKVRRKELLLENPDAWCFVCTGAAIRESYGFFERLDHHRFYQCCEDGSKHAEEAGYENTFQNVSL